LIPKSDSENELSFLDKSILDNPEVSLDQIKLGYKKMAKICDSGLLILKEYIFDQDEDKRHSLLEIERKLDEYQEKILEFIEELGKINLTEEQSEKITRYIHIINHFEQIGDLLETLAETPYKMAVKELNFTRTQKTSLHLALKKVLKTSCLCREAINYESKSYHEKVISAFTAWKESKEEILFKNRKLVIMKSLGIERMNYFVDLVLPLNEIAKKFTNVAWEACGGDNISLEREM
jgi:phosphate:Na+ symporter